MQNGTKPNHTHTRSFILRPFYADIARRRKIVYNFSFVIILRFCLYISRYFSRSLPRFAVSAREQRAGAYNMQDPKKIECWYIYNVLIVMTCHVKTAEMNIICYVFVQQKKLWIADKKAILNKRRVYIKRGKKREKKLNRTIKLSIILLSYLFYDSAKYGQLKAEESKTKTNRSFVAILQKKNTHNNKQHQRLRWHNKRLGSLCHFKTKMCNWNIFFPLITITFYPIVPSLRIVYEKWRKKRFYCHDCVIFGPQITIEFMMKFFPSQCHSALRWE